MATINIPGRRKKDGPSKAVMELFLFYMLRWEESFLCDNVCEEYHISLRTLFRYIRDIKRLFPKHEIRYDARNARPSFIAYDLWGDQPSTHFPDDPHINRLARLILLANETYNYPAYSDYYDYEEEAEPVFASDLMKVLEKTGLPPVSLRTLQRDLKDIIEARRLYRNFSS